MGISRAFSLFPFKLHFCSTCSECSTVCSQFFLSSSPKPYFILFDTIICIPSCWVFCMMFIPSVSDFSAVYNCFSCSACTVVDFLTELIFKMRAAVGVQTTWQRSCLRPNISFLKTSFSSAHYFQTVFVSVQISPKRAISSHHCTQKEGHREFMIQILKIKEISKTPKLFYMGWAASLIQVL